MITKLLQSTHERLHMKFSSDMNSLQIWTRFTADKHSNKAWIKSAHRVF